MIRRLDCDFSQVVQWLCAVLSPCFALHWSFWDSELPWDLQNWHMNLTASNCICLSPLPLLAERSIYVHLSLTGVQGRAAGLLAMCWPDFCTSHWSSWSSGFAHRAATLPVCSRDKSRCLPLWAEVPCRDLLQYVSPAQGDWMASLEILIPLDWCTESSVCSLWNKIHNTKLILL